MNRLLLACVACCLLTTSVFAQGEWIWRLDDDNNGMIEPDEIDGRARDYLERISRPFGLRLTRPNSIGMLRQAAVRYEQLRDRDDVRDNEDLDDNIAKTITSLKPDREQVVIPGFDSPKVRYPYTAEDLGEARGLIRRYDRDGDGVLNADEADRIRWRGGSPKLTDFNGDQKLTLSELAQRYSRRRLLDRAEELAVVPDSDRDDEYRGDRRRNRDDYRTGAGRSRRGDRGSDSLARSILDRYDRNRNDQLEANEMAAVGIPIADVDFDRSSGVERDELASYLFAKMEAAANEDEASIPTWFFERDSDGDQQIVMGEFSDDWDAETLEEFERFDANGDGIITRDEVLQSKHIVGGQFTSRRAEVLLPRSTIVSEIEIDEDYVIADLNVQLSISHTFVGQLDGYLISPDGERVELFTGVGGSDDHFDKTIFDDEADQNINRARPPFEGRFQPEPLARKRPGLSQFRNQNLRGIWQLMIRGSRSERSGVLHGWSLLVKPAEQQAEIQVDATERTSDPLIVPAAGESTSAP
ncbi:MAG: proprotein convertase P-domain-containing protein [Planctomycetota bacterium]